MCQHKETKEKLYTCRIGMIYLQSQNTDTQTKQSSSIKNVSTAHNVSACFVYLYIFI